jgi:hypothetical protein
MAVDAERWQAGRGKSGAATVSCPQLKAPRRRKKTGRPRSGAQHEMHDQRDGAVPHRRHQNRDRDEWPGFAQGKIALPLGGTLYAKKRRQHAANHLHEVRAFGGALARFIHDNLPARNRFCRFRFQCLQSSRSGPDKTDADEFKKYGSDVAVKPSNKFKN